MKYEINRPDAELTEGYFNLILKYIVLFIIAWIVCWLFLLYLSGIRQNRNSGFVDLLFDHVGTVSVAIAIFVSFYFGGRIYRKYQLGLLTSIDFDASDSSIELELLNTFNGTKWTKSIPKNNIQTSFILKEDILFGKQRLFELYNKNTLVTRLNVDLTAWCRNPDIDTMVTRLKSFANPQKDMQAQTENYDSL